MMWIVLTSAENERGKEAWGDGGVRE